MSRGAQAVFDARALENNLIHVRQAAPSSRIMAVVKANGYGHGLVRSARALSSADAFAVASIEEALTLRETGIAHPVTLLSGITEPRDLRAVSRHHLSCVVHSDYQIEMLEEAQPSAPISVWLKIDTGMHRLGIDLDALPSALQRLQRCPAIRKPFGLMTHLANADDPGDETSRRQLEVFEAATRGIDGPRSIANSGGILGWPATHAQWVRPGIMLYGASPFIDSTAADYGLEPVMTLESRLIAVKRLPRGAPVGYGGEWKCPEDMAVGVVAIGYGDGYPRHARVGTPVLLNGNRASLIGPVSMDMICVDLRGQPEAGVGDRVTLWGRGLPVEEVARCAGTISYELLCQVTPRVKVVSAQRP